MRKTINKLFLTVLAVSLTGCTMRLVDFTIISTKNVDLSRAATFKRASDKRVEGKDSVSIIIFIPTGVPNVKEAIDRAIESVPGAVALLDGVVSEHYWYIPYIYGKDTYVVEGTPLIDPALAANAGESQFMIAQVNKAGDKADVRYVSQEEYQKVRSRVLAGQQKAN